MRAPSLLSFGINDINLVMSKRFSLVTRNELPRVTRNVFFNNDDAKQPGALQFRTITIPQLLVSILYLLFGSRRFSILLHGSILFIPELPFHFLFRLKHTPIIFKDIHSEDQGSSKNGFEDWSIQTTSGCRHGISFPFEQHRPDINVLEVSASLTNARHEWSHFIWH